MRVFIASLATETNTFAPFPTGRGAFEENGLTKAASRMNEGMGGGALSVFRQLAEAAGHEVVESLTAYAQPAGRTLRAVYEEFRDEILQDLTAAGPIDLILLMLHGAMVADGYDDCEGDLIGRVRALAPSAMIGVELDPHCHLTAAMIEEADYIVTFKEYPHTDLADRARDLFALCAARRDNAFAALVDTKLIGLYPTETGPMRAIVDAALHMEKSGRVLSASIAHGFPWGDVADVGTRVLVYAEDVDSAEAAALELASKLYAAREELLPDYPDIATSLDRAAQLEGRIVLGDHGDNPGGGAAGDSTYILHALRERGWTNVALGPIWDPMAAALCCDAGVGANLSLRLGGKTGPASGAPLDLNGQVHATVRAHMQTAFGTDEPMGPSALFHADGVDIVIASLRAQAYGLDLFERLGVNVQERRLIVLKSSHHYKHAFGAIADHIWTVGSPGALSLDFANLPYTKRDAQFFPRVRDPWSTLGTPAPQIFDKGRT
jgi:microcystin degradation protein MlrC